MQTPSPSANFADERDDALSPTDGYFHASETSSSSHRDSLPAVPNVLVEDPTMQEASAAKAKEAESQHWVQNAAGNTSSYTYASFPPSASTSASRPQNHPDAPPAYSPSASASRYSQGGSTMGVPEEHQTLLPRQPQNMGGSSYQPPVPRWQRLKNTTHSPNFRSNIRTILGVAVVLSIFIALFGGVSIGGGSKSHIRFPKVIDLSPVSKIVMGGQRDLVWSNRGSCRNTPQKLDKQVSEIRFGSGHSLSIEQRPEKYGSHRGRQPDVTGQLYIRPSGESSSEGSVEIEIITNDENLTVDTLIKEESGKQKIEIITPRALDWWDYRSTESPCIQMRVTVYVPHNAYLDSLGLDIVHLDVHLVEGLVMGVIEGPIIHTVVGSVKTPLPADIEDDVAPYALQSRKIVVYTVSGDINGWFPLYGILQIDSTSGVIDIEVAPKPADKKSAKTAALSVKSTSGDITVKEPLSGAVHDGKLGKKLPPRDYTVNINSKSGRIRADVAMTSQAKFESVSGDLFLNLLPLVVKDSEKASLKTDTKSGKTTLNIYEPLGIDGNDLQSEKPTLADFQSTHSCISGNMHLGYPGSWVGKFQAKTMSGDISVTGKDVKITRESRWIPKSVEGEKGNGKSFMKLDSISGSLAVQVGQS